jgi:hypothetical protein
MRQFPFLLCASVVACGFSSMAGAASPLVFTLDLLAPCNASGCTGTHPTDFSLLLGANNFTFSTGVGTASGAFISALDLTAPVVCDEISAGGFIGPSTNQRFSPTYSNTTFGGGQLEFNAGGASVVDINAVSYDGQTPAGVSAVYTNYGATLPPQVGCYQINPISGGPVSLALGRDGIFKGGFETLVDTHFANEPWVSVQTVISPQSTGARGSQTSAPTDANAMNYVVQVHNASSAVNWHLDLGYDFAFFDPANNSQVGPKWCVLASSMPGPIAGSCAHNGTVSSAYTIAAADIQAATNSVYIYIENEGSAAAVASWNSLDGSFYPAVAALFPPFGTYAQRFDDKVAVASANNKPTFSIGSIICSNNTASTSCTIKDQDGKPVTAALTFQNSVTSGGAVTIDPIAYQVNPNSDSTLPGTTAQDAITVSNVSCSDPGILNGGIANGNFTTSTGAQGASKLSFSFAPLAGLFVPGTATCTATFTSAGRTPALSRTQSFTITMQQATTTHFAVTAPASSIAGASFNTLTVTALDGGNNVVGSYSGTVHFTSSDPFAAVPGNATLSGGTGSFSATLKSAGAQTLTATDTGAAIAGTSNAVNVSAAAATHFRVQAPANATTATPFNFAVTALDQFNNTDDSYAGTVHFSSNDGDVGVVLPVDATLTFGVSSFNATLITAGNHTISATDTVTGTITGTSGSINVQ